MYCNYFLQIHNLPFICGAFFIIVLNVYMSNVSIIFSMASEFHILLILDQNYSTFYFSSFFFFF